jgi:hypothetical protein
VWSSISARFRWLHAGTRIERAGVPCYADCPDLAAYCAGLKRIEPR